MFEHRVARTDLLDSVVHLTITERLFLVEGGANAANSRLMKTGVKKCAVGVPPVDQALRVAAIHRRRISRRSNFNACGQYTLNSAQSRANVRQSGSAASKPWL